MDEESCTGRLTFLLKNISRHIQRYAIIVKYFCSQVVFTEKLAPFRGYVKVGGKGQNNMKNIGARHDENVKMFFFKYLKDKPKRAQ